MSADAAAIGRRILSVSPSECTGTGGQLYADLDAADDKAVRVKRVVMAQGCCSQLVSVFPSLHNRYCVSRTGEAGAITGAITKERGMGKSQRRLLRKPAAVAANASVLVKTAFSLGAMLLLCLTTSRAAMAQGGHDFEFCQGYFALCSASTCTPTGNQIAVNVIGGGTANFPEADCTCPIFSGHAIADLAGGNMTGSCEPPSPDQIWSIYSLRTHIPQAINDWEPSGSEAAAPPLFCPAALNQGDQFVNCFSFACDSLRYINGVPVATCHCPIGESLEGKAVKPQTGFLTQAGQGDHRFCFKHPVAGPISLP
jgi:hypothetical protein